MKYTISIRLKKLNPKKRPNIPPVFAEKKVKNHVYFISLESFNFVTIMRVFRLTQKFSKSKKFIFVPAWEQCVSEVKVNHSRIFAVNRKMQKSAYCLP